MMPKINPVVKAARAVLEGDCAGPPAGPRVKAAVAVEVSRQRAERAVPLFVHAPADHMSFLNADGTRSRICVCPCDGCWPTDGTDTGHCPDWNDEV